MAIVKQEHSFCADQGIPETFYVQYSKIENETIHLCLVPEVLNKGTNTGK